MRDILELIKTRRSVRQYKDKEVSEDDLLKVLEAGRWAPSAVNRQPWHFVVVKDKSIRDQLSKSPFAEQISQAPISFVVCADESRSRWAQIDCALAIENIMLEAHSLGLGTCYVGGFNEERVKEILEIPERWKPIGIITLGYPKKVKKSSIRLPLEEISSENTFKRKGSVSGILKKGAVSFVGKVIKK
jgi:nitroreductase